MTGDRRWMGTKQPDHEVMLPRLLLHGGTEPPLSFSPPTFSLINSIQERERPQKWGKRVDGRLPSDLRSEKGGHVYVYNVQFQKGTALFWEINFQMGLLGPTARGKAADAQRPLELWEREELWAPVFARRNLRRRFRFTNSGDKLILFRFIKS